MSKNSAIHAAFFMEGLHAVVYKKVIDAISNIQFPIGVIELVDEIVGYAEFIDNILTVLGDEVVYPGVFDYEVSNAFGMWYGDYLIKNKEIPSVKASREFIWNEIIDFFKQADENTTIVERLIKLKESIESK